MGSVTSDSAWKSAQDLELDALVVGGGFGGIYTLHKLLRLGLKVKLFESGREIGGVWNWNRYPGARVDSEVPFYQFSLHDVWKDWTWTERFPGHAEIRRYFHHVATTLGLYDHIACGETVVGCDWDGQTTRWTVKSNTAKTVKCKYLVAAGGASHKQHYPAFAGLKTFRGVLLHASEFPEEGIDLIGKRVAVIGQGATGIQIVQEVSKVAGQLDVYIRTPNTAIPLRQRKITTEEQHQHKILYEHLFKMSRASATGFPFPSADKRFSEASPEEREARWESSWARGGFSFQLCNYMEFMADLEINEVVYNWWASKVRARVKDPRKREILAPLKPLHPFGAKRASLEQDYYECIDRTNVDLISLKQTSIEHLDETGIVMSDGQHRQYDVILLATGYDALTGSYTSMGLRDRHGKDIKENWKDGILTYLGMTCPGYPNMFMVYTPQAPTVLSNGTTIIEVQGDWVASTIERMRGEGINTLEARRDAAENWAADVGERNEKTLFSMTNSWYTGANIPGKKYEQMNWMGGIDEYEQICQGVHKEWTGFDTAPVVS